MRIRRMEANDDGAASTDKPEIIEKELSYVIVAAFFEVYNYFGFGFLESIYAKALELALIRRGIRVEREVPITIYFKGEPVGQHRIDILVEGRIIIEIKSSERVNDIAKRQLRNYLTATGKRLGLLLHFGPRAQVHRVLSRS
jgi:GxxExxY protein